MQIIDLRNELRNLGDCGATIEAFRLILTCVGQEIDLVVTWEHNQLTFCQGGRRASSLIDPILILIMLHPIL